MDNISPETRIAELEKRHESLQGRFIAYMRDSAVSIARLETQAEEFKQKLETCGAEVEGLKARNKELEARKF